MKFYSDFDVDRLTSEYIAWCNENGMGRNPNGLRFGQHICNQWLRRGQSFPKLYNEVTASRAYELAAQELNSRWT